MAGNSIHAGRTVTDKVASILLVFSEGSDYSLTEIARRANLPTSTTHRLVTELAGQGVLERTGTGRLRVGRAVRAIRGSHGPVTVIDRGPIVIDDLCAATGCRVRMGVLSDRDVAYVEKLPGQPAGEGFRRAGRLPTSATAVGRALLAFAPPATVEQTILSGLRCYTPRTVVVCPRIPSKTGHDSAFPPRDHRRGVRTADLWCRNARLRSNRGRRGCARGLTGTQVSGAGRSGCTDPRMPEPGP